MESIPPSGQPNAPRRLRVLLIAYACEPGKGSEPGVGWNMTTRLACKHDVTVVTRANNRPAITAALDKQCCCPRFIYVDPPACALALKKRGALSIQVFYALWQWWVAKRLRACDKQFDILHQLTFCSFEVPPRVFLGCGTVRLWGPLGGGQTTPFRLLGAFGISGGIREWLRGLRVRMSAVNPVCRRVLRSCSLVLYANRETRDLLGGCGVREHEMMIEAGVDAEVFSPGRALAEGQPVTALFGGRLEGRKGAVLLVEAFARLAAENANVVLRIVGEGEQRARLERLSERLGLDSLVTFVGAVSHDRMADELRSADLFVFPSLRDTAGVIVLEAMACGLPVVCFDHQGAAIMVGDDCGIKVPLRSRAGAVRGLAEAISRLAGDRAAREAMGKAAREVVMRDFDWSAKTERISSIYERLVDSASCAPD